MAKAQVWYIDMFIAFTILLIALVIFLQSSDPQETTALAVDQDAQAIAGLLVSPGYPVNWTTIDVIIPGVVEDYTVNDSKIIDLYTLTHNQLQSSFQTEQNIMIFLEYNGSIVDVGGNQFVGRNISSAASYVARAERIALYQNLPVSISVVVWTV